MATQEPEGTSWKGLGNGVVGAAFLVGIVYLVPGCIGCGESPKPGPVPPAPGWTNDGDTDVTPSKLDFTGLRGVLAGKWRRVNEAARGTKDSLNERNTILEFAGKSVEGKADSGPKNSGRFEMKSDSLSVTETGGKTSIYGLEFLSDGEIALSPDQVEYGGFDDLTGRWQRVSQPPGKQTSVLGTGPFADAKRQVQKIEAKIVKLEAIQKAALADRDEFAAKLRSVGVNSVANLKGNIRGQRLAENLVRLATEIEGRERQLAVVDTELLKAKSLVRRMEQEQAGLSEDEMRNLAVQLREVEERTDGAASIPTTPLDVDAAVEKALKGSTAPKKSK